MSLNILLIGGGGREHAIASAVKRSGGNLYSYMENRNPGIIRLSDDFLISSNLNDVLKWKYVADGKIDFAIVGPEAPLEQGIVNSLENIGILSASPSKEAAQIETSKKFMRNLMEKYSIPGNVESHYFSDEEEIIRFMRDFDRPFAVKPVGLTGGKGVRVQGDHFQSKEEGIRYAIEVIRSGIGEGKGVLIEERMLGEEYTLQAFTDGNNLIPMPLVQDFKRALEDDKGPNTGGMGSYSMADHRLPFIDEQSFEKSVEILRMIVHSLKREGITYKGTIYGQFMLTKYGPKVIEINARFGDPEAINVLTIFEGDFLKIIEGMATGNLSVKYSRFSNDSTVVKYLVPEGYGTNPAHGMEIVVDESGIERSGAIIYFGSVNERNGKYYTTHSRTIAIVGRHMDLYTAEEIAENATKFVTGRLYHRRDIGKRETIEKKVRRMEEILKDP
ncbi:MAG: phosphoribosylamine--glycine ligase [Thermoplasmata archaeon]